LQAEDREEEKKRGRREMIERIKSNCIPEPLRSELPPHILLLTLNTIAMELSKLDITLFSEDEVTAYAMIVRDKIWTNPEYFSDVMYSKTRSIFRFLDAYMHEEYRKWKEASIQAVADILEEREGIPPETTRSVLIGSNQFSYDSFLKQCFLDLMVKDPDGYKKVIKNMVEFLCVSGRRDLAEENVKALEEMEKLYLRYMQGGENSLLS